MLALWYGCLRTQNIYTPCVPGVRLSGPMPQPCPALQSGVLSGLAIMVEVTSFTLMALFIATPGHHGPPQHTRSRPTWPRYCRWCRCRWFHRHQHLRELLAGVGQAFAQRVVYIGFSLQRLLELG